MAISSGPKGISIRVTGLDATRRDLERGLEREVERLRVDLTRALARNTPIRSGQARRSWTSRATQTGATIENRQPYIGRLEDNWSRQTRGRGIIRPALEEVNIKYKGKRRS